jgi:RNA polymerase sigma-70 factor (ECF subfamily)
LLHTWSNFPAWVHRVMINHFVSGARNKHEFSNIENIPDQPVSASHEERTALRELSWALKRLPPDQREALFMIALDEVRYETAVKRTGCAIGTLKSRVHRARKQLWAYMIGQGNNLPQAASHPG